MTQNFKAYVTEAINRVKEMTARQDAIQDPYKKAAAAVALDRETKELRHLIHGIAKEVFPDEKDQSEYMRSNGGALNQGEWRVSLYKLDKCVEGLFSHELSDEICEKLTSGMKGYVPPAYDYSNAYHYTKDEIDSLSAHAKELGLTENDERRLLAALSAANELLVSDVPELGDDRMPQISNFNSADLQNAKDIAKSKKTLTSDEKKYNKKQTRF